MFFGNNPQDCSPLGQFLAGFVGYPDLKVGGLFSETTAAPYLTGTAAFKFRVVAFMRTFPHRTLINAISLS